MPRLHAGRAWDAFLGCASQARVSFGEGSVGNESFEVGSEVKLMVLLFVRQVFIYCEN